MNDKKTCKKCLQELPISEFHHDKNLSDGHRNICKRCATRRAFLSRIEIKEKTNGLFDVLHSMKSRCYNSKHKSYFRYGGRGITVCEEWLNNQENFYKWAMNHGYKHGLQIDRINNNLGYSPDNCRFVSPARNQHNKSNNRFSEKQIRFIRKIYSHGILSQRKIAKFFNVNAGTICLICSKKRWKDINE